MLPFFGSCVIHILYTVCAEIKKKIRRQRVKSTDWMHALAVLYMGWQSLIDCVWNVMAHAQKPDFVFRRNGRVHLNRQGCQFSRLLAAEVCASAIVMLDTPCSEVVWRVLASHYIRQFPLHFPSRASPCAITFQLDSKKDLRHPTRNRNLILRCSVLYHSYYTDKGLGS